MDGNQFANTLCSSCTGIGSSLNSTDVAANHNGHQTAAHMDFADQVNICCATMASAASIEPIRPLVFGHTQSFILNHYSFLLK